MWKSISAWPRANLLITQAQVTAPDVELRREARRGDRLWIPDEEPIDVPADESPDSEEETDMPEPLLNNDAYTFTVIHFLGVDDAPLDSIHYSTDEAWMEASTEEKYHCAQYYTALLDRHEASAADPISSLVLKRLFKPNPYVDPDHAR